MSLRLENLKPNEGAKHRIKRLGCGESSGHGKTSGKGHKGQKARAGAAIRPAWPGGQIPLYRRLPKKGFNNAQFRTVYEVVNVRDLEARFDDGDVVSEETLKEAGLLNHRYEAIKILGDGSLTKKLTVQIAKVSASAKSKIEAAGGSIEAPAAASDSEG